MDSEKIKVLLNVMQYRDVLGGGSVYAQGLIKLMLNSAKKLDVNVVSARKDERWEVGNTVRNTSQHIIPHKYLHPRGAIGKIKRAAYDLGVIPSAKKIETYFRNNDCDVVHFPGDRVSPYIKSKPTVLTVFGGNYWALPHDGSGRVGIEKKIVIRNIRKSIKFSDAVLVPSVFMKNLLVQHVSVNPEKIFVSPLVVWPSLLGFAGEDIKGKPSTGRDVGDPYILYAAAQYPYKNHRVLFEAIKLLRDRYSLQVKIKMTGKVTPDIESDILKFRVSDVCETVGFVDRATLRQLYADAAGYVHPSLYEAGGSFSIFEAIQLGCPAICSSVGSIGELAPTRKGVFDPYSPNSVARLVSRLVRSEDFRDELIGESNEWLRQFTIERSCSEHVAAYRYAIENYTEE